MKQDIYNLKKYHDSGNIKMNTYILRENHTHYLPRTQPTLSLFI